MSAKSPIDKPSKPPIRLAHPDGRPDIIIKADVHVTTQEMIAALRSDTQIYQRSGQIVHVVRAEDTEECPAGTPVVRASPLSFAVDRVSAHARCLAKKDGEWKHVSPPKDSVRAVLERGSWSGIRTLDGVIEAPSMRPDGSILQVAYSRLADVFCDFPYVDESHRSATVAAVLSILARPAIVGAVPCWLFDASTSRSGKSLQVDVISLIATGRTAPRMTFPETDEELEKVLSGYALSGARLVNFDNVARAFGGAALDKCITASSTVQLRILGTQDMPVLPWLALILASGNNVYARGDMLARVLCPRLESPLENPETRDSYSRPDRGGEDALCAWVRGARRHLVVDALTLLRAFCVAGKPAQPVPKFGGFSAWRSLIAQAMVWAGAPDPLGARRGLGGDDDPQRANEAGLVSGWARLCAEQGVPSLTASGAIAHLYPPPRRDDPPDRHDGLRESIQGLTGCRPGFPPAADRLGRALRKLKARPLGGKKLTVDGETSGAVRWMVLKS